jgi:hypothetical protein
MSLKKTSETIMIGVSTPAFSNSALSESQVDLQLNPLDNEVFVVQAIEFDLASTVADTDFDPTTNGGVATAKVSVSTTSRSSIGTLADSNVLATAHLAMSNTDTTGDANGFDFQQKPDTAAAILDYIGIISTADFFIQTSTVNLADNLDAGALRLYGYRARADAATYAALVQSEVLSS